MTKIKKFLYKMLVKGTRYYYLKKGTNFLGTYTIEPDKITIYLNKKYLKLFQLNKIINKIEFYPAPKDIRRLCGLDKPVEYIVEKVKFDKPLEIYCTSNNTIHFKNCEFNESIYIRYADSIIFEDNTYYDKTNVYFGPGKCFLTGLIKIDKIKWINDNFKNSADPNRIFPPRFGIDIFARTVEIIDSNIKTDGLGYIDIEADNLIQTNSNITAPEIKLATKEMITDDNSSLIAEKEIIIENENQDEIKQIKTLNIKYNGISLKGNDSEQKIDINKEFVELTKARQELTTTLKKYAYQYNEYYEKEIVPNFTIEAIQKSLQRKKEK